jgi:hypothetical protein
VLSLGLLCFRFRRRYNGAGGPDDHAGIAAPPFRLQVPYKPKSWVPVFRQTLPGLFAPNQYSLNPTKPSAPMFSVMDSLEGLRTNDSQLQFKMNWPDPTGKEEQVWKQTSNPYANSQARVSGVTGYEAVSCPQTANAWGGLEANLAGESLLDGSVGSAEWFYAVGYFGLDWGNGVAIPAYGRAAKAVELHAVDPKTKQWAIVFRQVLPVIWKPGEWRKNADDPHSEAFSILDELERFRDPADGKFTLKLTWPDYCNSWTQTSNPTLPASAKVVGYQAVNVDPALAAEFGGLRYVDQALPAFNGTCQASGDSGSTWFFCLGYGGAHWYDGGGIPWTTTSEAGVHVVELYVSRE